ncbi:MAG: sigma-70 family RNA polymerase sigma factor [Polyangiaceae bacterium]
MSAEASDDHCDPKRLLDLVRRRDESAFDQITRCYGARLLAAGRRHCRSASEAEDAVQDTLLFAAGGLEAFRAEGSLEGFLVRIVARACRRLSRGQKNDAALHDAEADPEAPDDSPETQAARGELSSELERILLSLEPNDRALLLLAELEDYSAREIGEQLHINEGAVRTRLSRLRKRMRDELAPWLPDPTPTR